MRDRRWHREMNEGGSVAAARGVLRHGRSGRSSPKYAPLLHLCARNNWEPARVGTLRVPGNGSAASARIALAPAWLFSHFPYGSFFDEFRRCHDGSWDWAKASAVELRLCMPEHRVPSIMVHMAGLRQESWGRRVLMRALGVWQDAADAVAPGAWVSARALAGAAVRAGGAADGSDDGPGARRRVAAWTAVGRLLVTDGVVAPAQFSAMGEYDRFAARLLLLGLLLGRRVVMPPIACDLPYMRKALQARHLRGMEVGCGPMRQCVWLPYPHHIDPYCSGVDFLWDADYRALVARGAVAPHDTTHVPAAAFQLRERGGGGGGGGGGGRWRWRETAARAAQ